MRVMLTCAAVLMCSAYPALAQAKADSAAVTADADDLAQRRAAAERVVRATVKRDQFDAVLELTARQIVAPTLANSALTPAQRERALAVLLEEARSASIEGMLSEMAETYAQ